MPEPPDDDPPALCVPPPPPPVIEPKLEEIEPPTIVKELPAEKSASQH